MPSGNGRFAGVPVMQMNKGWRQPPCEMVTPDPQVGLRKPCRFAKLRNKPSNQSTAANSGPMPLSFISSAAGAVVSMLSDFTNASRSASTAAT
jgi:hypothetical protein